MTILQALYSEQLKNCSDIKICFAKRSEFSFEFKERSEQKNNSLEELIAKKLEEKEWTLHLSEPKWYDVMVFLNKSGVSSVTNVDTFDVNTIKDKCNDYQLERVNVVIEDLKKLSKTVGVSTLYAILQHSESEQIKKWLNFHVQMTKE